MTDWWTEINSLQTWSREPDNIPTWEEFKEMAELFLKNGMRLEVDKDDVERAKQTNIATRREVWRTITAADQLRGDGEVLEMMDLIPVLPLPSPLCYKPIQGI